MNLCRTCHKQIFKKDETIFFREFGQCDECCKKSFNFTKEDLEIFTNEQKYYEYKQETYFEVHYMFDFLIKLNKTTEQELNEKIPNWRELQEAEREYMNNTKWLQMKKYWPDKKIEKYKQEAQKEFNYYTKGLL